MTGQCETALRRWAAGVKLCATPAQRAASSETEARLAAAAAEARARDAAVADARGGARELDALRAREAAERAAAQLASLEVPRTKRPLVTERVFVVVNRQYQSGLLPF